MQNKKLAFYKDVIQIVYQVCRMIFNAQPYEISKVFGISSEQMEGVVRDIVDAIPDRIFSDANSQGLEEIKSICAREFIFFQVQEKWDDPRYQDDLRTFIAIFTRDIEKCVTTSDNQIDIRQE